MTKDTWEDFSNQVDNNLLLNNTPTSVTTTNSLETTWHKISNSIIQAALQHIHNKKYTVRNFFHTFTPTATSLHKDLKDLGSIIKQTQHYLNNNTPLSPNIPLNIQHLNQKHNFEITNPPTKLSILPEWISNTKSYWKSLYHARNLENSKALN